MRLAAARWPTRSRRLDNVIDLIDIGFAGESTGYARANALGHNPDADTGTLPEDIWTGGGVYPWMTAATSLEIVSSSANDTAAGTGARSVTVSGLDFSGNPVTTVVTLNGTTAVALSVQLYRVNLASVRTAGTGKTNEGILTIRNAGAGTTRAVIPAGYGITRQSAYTVPAGYSLQILSLFFGFNRAAGGARYATFATYIQSPSGVYRMPLEITVGDDVPYRHDGAPGLTLPERTDFCLRCTALSSDNSDLSGAWLGVLKRN